MKTKYAVLLIVAIGLVSFIVGHESRKLMQVPDPARIKILIDTSGTRPAWVDRDSTIWMEEECICFLGVGRELISLDSARPIMSSIFEHSNEILRDARKDDPSFSWGFRNTETYWEKYLIETTDGVKRECYTVYILVRFHIYSSLENPRLGRFLDSRVAYRNAGFFSEF